MKRILSLLIIFGIGLSLGMPISPKDVKLPCKSSREIKCPLSEKSNLNNSPFSCPKSGKSSKCQKNFINFIIENNFDQKLNLIDYSKIELIIDSSLKQTNSYKLFNNNIPQSDSDPPLNLPLLI